MQCPGPYLGEVLAAGEHPMLTRHVLEAEEPDPDIEFAFGLECVLAGLVVDRSLRALRAPRIEVDHAFAAHNVERHRDLVVCDQPGVGDLL